MDWHRVFGAALIDLFTGSPFEVEVEKDLSVQQQLLDVVVVRRRPGPVTVELPDGFEELADHNLISFKSLHEALDGPALRELAALSVAYRKLTGVGEGALGLFGVRARFPDNLARAVGLHEVRPGVYDCQWAIDPVRVVVANALPPTNRNAVV